MRERTSWNREEINRTAAMPKQADPYLMNQDHVSQNPRADKYMNGTPSTWAEDVHSPNEWEKEYSGGTTKRNEIGEAEFRPETFNHPEKTASNALLVRKADLCVKVARQMFPKAAEGLIEDQAVALMSLPDSDLIETFQRLAQQDDQGQGEEQKPQQQQAAQQGEQEQAPAQQQQQAGQQQQQTQQAGQQDQQQQAGQQQQMQSAAYQQAAQQAMQAMQQGDQQKMQAAVQQMVQEAMKQQGSQADFPGGQWGKNNPVASAKRAQDQGQQGQGEEQKPQQQQAAQQGEQEQAPAQQQQQAGQQQQQMQSAQQQQIEAMVQQAVQQAMQQQSGQQQQMPPAEAASAIQGHDDALLDEMLAPAAPAEAGMGEIELEPAPMDVGEVGLGPDDDVLKSLFATQESQDAEQAQQQQGQQHQASVVRSPSSRTVGTRPTAGVARVGGPSAPQSKTAAANDVDKLAALWSSAPDVREHFGIK